MLVTFKHTHQAMSVCQFWPYKAHATAPVSLRALGIEVVRQLSQFLAVGCAEDGHAHILRLKYPMSVKVIRCLHFCHVCT
jgi:hypothetical protein